MFYIKQLFFYLVSLLILPLIGSEPGNPSPRKSPKRDEVVPQPRFTRALTAFQLNALNKVCGSQSIDLFNAQGTYPNEESIKLEDEKGKNNEKRQSQTYPKAAWQAGKKSGCSCFSGTSKNKKTN